MKIQVISVADIVEDPNQPRKHHSDEGLQGLADSLRQHGILNPITVAPVDGRFRIITGERRWRASKIAGIESIPCVVKQVDEESRLTEQLIENLQREDLQPIEKSRAIQHVKESLNLTNREISKRLGLSERAVGYLLDLLALPESIGEQIISRPNRPAEGQLTEKHARFLKQLNDTPELQEAVVERVREDRLSSDDTGSLVRALKRTPDRAREIMDSSSDQLAAYLSGGPDPLEGFFDTPPHAAQPASAHRTVQDIMGFLPTLSTLPIGQMNRIELTGLRDALESLTIATEGVIKSVITRLEETK